MDDAERVTLDEIHPEKSPELLLAEAVGEKAATKALERFLPLIAEEREVLLAEFQRRLDQRDDLTRRAIRKLRDDVTSEKIERELEAVPTGQATESIVLLVDDDAHLRMLLRRLCESRGMKVWAADGPESAMNILDLEPIDVVLADLAMPKNGQRLHEYVRQAHQGCEVVLMSGGDESEAASRALDSGAFGFLTKPFRSNEQVILTITRAAEARKRRRHGPGR